jgi:hypothetical protein
VLMDVQDTTFWLTILSLCSADSAA